MKQWGKYFEKAMTKEERDEWEKNRLFRNKYRNTFDAIGGWKEIIDIKHKNKKEE